MTARRVSWPKGSTSRSPTTNSTPQGRKPGAAVLGIRPEHVGLNAGESWPFTAKVPVEIVEPMGSDTLVWTQLGKQNFTIRIASERMPGVGDTVAVGFDPMNASLFDAASGERL